MPFVLDSVRRWAHVTMHTTAKQECIIEAVRRGFEGDAAVEFVCREGYAMNSAAIVRYLRSMGGRGHIHDLIKQGRTNLEILHLCFPETPLDHVAAHPPEQEELFEDKSPPLDVELADDEHAALYETTKLSIRIPSDLFEAIRLAARAENKTQTQLVVDILTSALSRMPAPSQREP